MKESLRMVKTNKRLFIRFMMIRGIGVDMVNIKRLNLEHTHFINRILTVNELNVFNHLKNQKSKLEFLAGRFASKEAYLKANQKGIGEIPFKEIEVLNLENGAPYFTNDANAKISISHDGDFAIAFVIIEEEKDDNRSIQNT